MTTTETFWYTTDTGRTWNKQTGPTPPNGIGLEVLHFHPTKSDYLVWTGAKDCTHFNGNCHIEAYYTTDNGRNWKLIDTYVRNCNWARDKELLADPNQIICESYKIKQGNQLFFKMDNPFSSMWLGLPSSQST